MGDIVGELVKSARREMVPICAGPHLTLGRSEKDSGLTPRTDARMNCPV